MSVTTRIEAPPARVWAALAVPGEVAAWDGVTPLDVPADYPAPSQHARWRTSIGPLRLTLHDRISAVDPGTLLASVIDITFIHVEEEYRLTPRAAGATELVSTDIVTSHVRGLTWLAVRLVRSDLEASMSRLKAYCERV